MLAPQVASNKKRRRMGSLGPGIATNNSAQSRPIFPQNAISPQSTAKKKKRKRLPNSNGFLANGSSNLMNGAITPRKVAANQEPQTPLARFVASENPSLSTNKKKRKKKTFADLSKGTMAGLKMNGSSGEGKKMSNKPVVSKQPSSAASPLSPKPVLAPTKPSLTLFSENKLKGMLKWKPNQAAPCPGLHNLGNTCFLNSVLQCLAYTPPLTNYLLSREHSARCRKNGYCLMCQMEKHVAMTFSQRSAFAPQAIVKNLRLLSKRFYPNHQQDSHEFLRLALDALQECALAADKPTTERAVKETSLIYRIFGGYLRSQVKCCECGFESNTYDPFLDLSLEVPQHSNIQKAFSHFTAVEILDKDNKYRCSRCKLKVKARKQLTIFQAPTVLVLHLKRFAFTQFHGNKINAPVKFDPTLDLQPYLSTRRHDSTYSLYAVLVHQGSTPHSGHYFCFVKLPSGAWVCANDSTTHPVKLQQVLSQMAYILFYIKEDMIPHSLPLSAAPSPLSPPPEKKETSAPSSPLLPPSFAALTPAKSTGTTTNVLSQKGPNKLQRTPSLLDLLSLQNGEKEAPGADSNNNGKPAVVENGQTTTARKKKKKKLQTANGVAAATQSPSVAMSPPAARAPLSPAPAARTPLSSPARPPPPPPSPVARPPAPSPSPATRPPMSPLSPTSSSVVRPSPDPTVSPLARASLDKGATVRNPAVSATPVPGASLADAAAAAAVSTVRKKRKKASLKNPSSLSSSTPSATSASTSTPAVPSPFRTAPPSISPISRRLRSKKRALTPGLASPAPGPTTTTNLKKETTEATSHSAAASQPPPSPCPSPSSTVSSGVSATPVLPSTKKKKKKKRLVDQAAKSATNSSQSSISSNAAPSTPAKPPNTQPLNIPKPPPVSTAQPTPKPPTTQNIQSENPAVAVPVTPTSPNNAKRKKNKKKRTLAAAATPRSPRIQPKVAMANGGPSLAVADLKSAKRPAERDADASDLSKRTKLPQSNTPAKPPMQANNPVANGTASLKPITPSNLPSKAPSNTANMPLSSNLSNTPAKAPTTNTPAKVANAPLKTPSKTPNAPPSASSTPSKAPTNNSSTPSNTPTKPSTPISPKPTAQPKPAGSAKAKVPNNPPPKPPKPANNPISVTLMQSPSNPSLQAKKVAAKIPSPAAPRSGLWAALQSLTPETSVARQGLVSISL